MSASARDRNLSKLAYAQSGLVRAREILDHLRNSVMAELKFEFDLSWRYSDYIYSPLLYVYDVSLNNLRN